MRCLGEQGGLARSKPLLQRAEGQYVNYACRRSAFRILEHSQDMRSFVACCVVVSDPVRTHAGFRKQGGRVRKTELERNTYYPCANILIIASDDVFGIVDKVCHDVLAGPCYEAISGRVNHISEDKYVPP